MFNHKCYLSALLLVVIVHFAPLSWQFDNWDGWNIPEPDPDPDDDNDEGEAQGSSYGWANQNLPEQQESWYESDEEKRMGPGGGLWPKSEDGYSDHASSSRPDCDDNYRSMLTIFDEEQRELSTVCVNKYLFTGLPTHR